MFNNLLIATQPIKILFLLQPLELFQPLVCCPGLKSVSWLDQIKFSFEMGGAQSQSRQVLKYFEKEWEYISTNSENIKVFRNRDNDKEAEAHTVAIDPHNSLTKEYDIYNYRRTQDNALVSVYAVNNIKDTSPNLCGNRDVLKVMVERIPIKGHQLKRLSFPEGVYMLSESLRGYEDCYSKVGTFSISDQMMGLNPSGQVKVWLNDNFAENHPPHEKPLLQITEAKHFRQQTEQQQQHMVQSLIRIVESKCKERFPQDFSHSMRQQATFLDAYQAVEHYCLTHNVDVPDRILVEGKSNLTAPFTQMGSQNMGGEARKKNQSDFSFKQTNNGRQTIINNLGFDYNQNNQPNGTLQQPQNVHLSFNPPNNHLSYNSPPNHISYNPATTHLSNNSYSPPKLKQQSLYVDRPQQFSYQQPKISLKPAMERGPSPARGVNFSYQSAGNRGMGPFGSNYVTSSRF